MSSNKFLRTYLEPSLAANYGFTVNALQSVYPVFYTSYLSVPEGFHDLWYKLRFRINLDVDQYFNITECFPVFEFDITTGYGGEFYVYMEAAPASVPGEQPFVLEYLGLNANAGSASVSIESNGYGSWPSTGVQTDGLGVTQSMSEPFMFFTPERRFFNTVNDVLIHNYVQSGVLYSDIYFDVVSGSGTMQKIGGFSSEIPYATQSYSDLVNVNININLYETPAFSTAQRTEFFVSTSIDVFQVQFGTGSIPAGLTDKNAPLIVSGGNGGYGSDFSEFTDHYDFIDKVRPRTSTYTPARANFVFYEGYYNGWYIPFFNLSGPNIFAAGNWYSEAEGVYYFDYQKFTNIVSTYYEPYDGSLIGPYVELISGAPSPVGLMMGPLSVGGSLGPTDPEVRITLSPIHLRYALVQAPNVRRGLFLQKSSGSPQLTLEPVWPTSSWHLSGDMWFSDTTGSWRGLFYADYSSSVDIQSASTSSIVPYKVFATTGSRNYIDGGSW